MHCSELAIVCLHPSDSKDHVVQNHKLETVGLSDKEGMLLVIVRGINRTGEEHGKIDKTRSKYTNKVWG